MIVNFAYEQGDRSERTFNKAREGDDGPRGVAQLFYERGFVFVSPNEKEIVLSDDFSAMSQHVETGAYIAIHPDLAAEMR